ncbi:hypothetical protein TNIN_391381 [Trichonephila inaurata madagascariensis]|uniref:Uncharacterized protein n=1 Tax=Trichonephila inaurata madagascariensis TaxID=2747483 RepID=A0A8X6XQT4_9ARAC|nr:hypothetical protein TNIN_391381 [Trichonephila inaurata madagascariensis]
MSQNLSKRCCSHSSYKKSCRRKALCVSVVGEFNQDFILQTVTQSQSPTLLLNFSKKVKVTHSALHLMLY